MDKLADNIVKKLQAKKIKPLPKWVFTGQNLLFWSALVLNTIFGAFAVSLVIFIFTNSNPITLNSTAEIFIFSFPFFWLVLSAILLLVGYFNFRKTENGYKVTVTNFAIKNLGVVLMLAAVFWLTGISERFNTIFSENIPLYRHIADTRYNAWSHPAIGRLAGVIEDYDSKTNIITLRDFNQTKWDVNYSKARFDIDLEKNIKVKIVGKIVGQDNEHSFNAERIMPWDEGMGMRRKMQ